MNYAPIAQLGETILRDRARPVIRLDNSMIELIDRLISTAIANKGVGIAAPQIFQSHRIFIVASHPSDRYPHAPTMPPTAMINPYILNHSREMTKDWEGCLSVPNTRGLVPRYRQIEVAYTTRAEEKVQTVLNDFVARIFQHELDHLNGIIFTDRIIDSEDLYTEAEYQQLISRAKT